MSGLFAELRTIPLRVRDAVAFSRWFKHDRGICCSFFSLFLCSTLNTPEYINIYTTSQTSEVVTI